MKNGFTLVELSIVLVIIGLLVGGVLVGQSLIDSAKVNKLVSYMSQVDIAQQQFKSKYRCVAGDCNRGFSPAGNGDGKLDPHAWISGVLQVRPENRAFWKHISEGGFRPENVAYSDAYTTQDDMVLGENAPEIDGFDNITMFVNNSPGTSLDNNYVLSDKDKNVAGTTDDTVGGFNPSFGIAFDQKIDDGHPVSVVNAVACGLSAQLESGPTPPYQLDMSVTDELCRMYLGFDFTIRNYQILDDSQLTATGY